MTAGCSAATRVCLLALSALLLTACSPSTPPPPAPTPLPLSYAPSLGADERAWAEAAWARVWASCGGLRRYGDDLRAAPETSRRVADYFDGREAAFLATVEIVAEPTHARLREFYLQGRRCEFAIEYPGAGAVQVSHRPCQQLCLDRPVDSEGQDLRLRLP